MLKERVSVLRKLAIATDLFIAGFSFVLGFRLYDGIGSPSEYFTLLTAFCLIWCLLLYSFKMYESFRTRKLYSVYWIIIKSCLGGFIIFSSIIYILRLETVSRSLVNTVFLTAAVLLALAKTGVILFFRAIRRKGLNYRQMLVIGANRRAQHFIELVREHSSWGFRIVGIIDEDESRKGQEFCGCRVLGTFKDVPHVLKTHVVDEVVFIVPRSWLNKIEEVMFLCEELGLRIHLAVDYFDLHLSHSKLSELQGFPLLTFESAPAKVWSLLFKRCFDIIFSGIMLLVLLPLLVVVALAVKLTSPGRILFKQKRVGLNGRTFNLYKFRTMVKDAELKLNELRVHNEMTGPVFKMKNDPRVTPLGRLLRKFSLDELPQLWNVFRGDMSIVGPRPPLPTEVKEYNHCQRRRLSMRPGITCLWQVSGRNRIVDFDQWVKLDLDYIDHWSLWLDARILLKTVPVVILGIGAK